METEPIPFREYRKGRRRKNKRKAVVIWFGKLESRISWAILKVINRVTTVPYRKLFPSPIDKCQWCGHTQNLTVINGDDYDQSPISVCTNVAECTERYWAKGF